MLLTCHVPLYAESNAEKIRHGWQGVIRNSGGHPALYAARDGRKFFVGRLEELEAASAIGRACRILGDVILGNGNHQIIVEVV